MEKQALLTVVIPIYNGEKIIEKTVKNILNSTYEEMEIILVDDGSLDASGEVCRRLEQKDSRVRYIYKENGGISSARNIGLQQARGSYICFCDQDDEVETQMYAKVIGRMLKTSAELGMCSTGRNINGEKSIYEKLQDGCYEGEDILKYLLCPLLFRGYKFDFVEEQNYLYGTLWKCIFSKEMLQRGELMFRSFVSYEDDWLFVTQALTVAQKVVTVSDIGYYWKVHAASRSHKAVFIEDMPERLDRLNEWENRYLAASLPKEIYNAYQDIRWCERYVWLLENGLPKTKRAQRGKYCKKIRICIEETGYKCHLEVLSYLKGNALKRKLMLWSLRYLGVRTSFAITPIIEWAIQRAEHFSWIVRLERKWKTKGKENT